MAELKFGIYGDSTSFKKALEEATKGVTQAKTKIESEGKSMSSVFDSLKKATTGLGVAFGLNELKNLGVQIAKTRSDFQQLEVSFKTMLGSGEKANVMLKQLTTTAATTPFGLQEVAGGAKQLLAYGIEAEKVNDMLIRLGDIASGLSIPLNDLVYLYGTTMTQGRMFTQDLRQFQGRGIPIADELAKQFGIAKSQVGEFVTAGKVGAKEVEQAIINMTSAGSQFGGLMKAQSETIGGRWSNIEDQIDMAFNEIGQNSEGFINGFLDSINYLIENYKTIGTYLGGIIASYGVWKATLLAHNAISKTMADGEVANLTKIAKANLDVLKAKEQWLNLEMEEADKNNDVDKYVELGTQKEALAKEIETAEEQLNTLAKTQNTTATQANAVATTTNATTTKASTIATKSNTLAVKAQNLAYGLGVKALGLFRGAWNALKTAFMSNPIGMIAIGITSVITAISAWRGKQDEMNKSLEEGKEKAKSYFDALKQEGGTIKSYVSTIRDKNANDLEQIKAYRELMKLVPEITNQYTQQELAALNATKAEELLTEAINNREIARAKKAGELASSISTQLDNGKKWEDFTPEERKFLSGEMQMDKEFISGNPDKAKIQLREVAKEANVATNNLTQLNKIAELQNMSKGEKKTKALKAEMEKLKTQLDGLNNISSYNGIFDKASEYASTKANPLLNRTGWDKEYNAEVNRLIKERENAKSALLASFNIDPNELSTEEFDELIARLKEQVQNSKKQLQDEIDADAGIDINPIINLNEKQAESEMVKVENQINTIIRENGDAFTIEELEKTIATYIDADVDDKDAQLALSSALFLLNEKAKELGQDRYIFSDINLQAKVNAKFENGTIQNLTNFSDKDLLSADYFGGWTTGTTKDGTTAQLQVQLAQQTELARRYKQQYESLKNDRLKNTTPTKTKKSGGKGKSQAELKKDAEKASQDLAELEKEIAEERAENTLELTNEITQLEINAEKDAHKARLAQIELDRKKEDEELKKRKEDAIKEEIENQKKLFEAREKATKAQQAKEGKKYTEKVWSDDMIDQSKVNEIKTTYDKLIEASNDLHKAQSSMEVINSRRQYLAEYGSSLAQELAITEEYADKIAKARAEGNTYEISRLEKERDSKIDSAQTQKLVENIDWITALGGNFSTAFKGALEPTLQQLRAYSKTSAFAKLDATNQKSIADAINSIEAIIGTGGLGWKDLSQSILEYKKAVEKQTKAIEKEKQAEKELNDAKALLVNATTQDEKDSANEQIKNAEKRFVQASNAVVDANKNVSASQSNLAMTSKSVLAPMDSIGNFLKTSGLSQLESLWSAFQQLKGGIDGLKALKDASKSASDVAKDASDSVKEASKNATDVADASEKIGEASDGVAKNGGKLSDKIGELSDELETAGLVGQIVSAVLSVFDILKDGVGTLVGSILDSILSAVNGILDNILSGQFIEDIFGTLVDGIGNILKTLGNAITLGLFEDWFFFDSEQALQDKLDRLSESNDALRYAIGELKTTIEQSSFGDALDAYEQAIGDNAQSEENARKQMQLAGSASTSGFLGINSKGSSFREVTKNLNAEEWARVSAITGESVNSASDFFNLTSEQMHEVATRAPEIWAKIKYHASQGYKDASVYMDEYIELWKDADELTEQLINKLTATSLDDLKSTFGDFFSDLESEVYDFGRTFEEVMANAIKESMMAGFMGEELKRFQEKWAEMTKSGGGLDVNEVAELRQDWNNLAILGKETYEAQLEALGISTDYMESTSSASNRGIESMTQQEAEELNGRFTALQISGEGIRQQSAQTNALLMALTSQIAPCVATSAESSNTLYELRELAISRNGYLSDISDYTKNLVAIKKTLSNIETNTQNL